MMKNYDIENELIPHLLAGEKLVWTGRPKTGVRFKPTDAFLIPFSLVWCGFVVFWEATAMAMGAPLIFMLFGIPFGLADFIYSSGASSSMQDKEQKRSMA